MPNKTCFRLRGPDWRVADTKQHDARSGAMRGSIHIDPHRGASQREVAMSAVDLLKSPTPVSRPRWQLNLGQNLAGFDRCREQAVKEIVGWNKPGAVNAFNTQTGATSHHDGGQFGGRVCMRQAAADRAAVANLNMRNMRHRCRQQRTAGADLGAALDGAVAWRVTAPMSSPEADLEIPESPSTRLRSIKTDGVARRKFNAGIKL